MYLATVHVLLSNICNTHDSFINWTCRKLSHIFSSATFNSETDEGFKLASCVAPQTRYLHSIHIWRVIRWSMFLFKQLLAVLVEALLRDMCNACRAPCIFVESAAPSGSSRLHSSMKFGSSEINKQLQLLFATTFTLTSRHSDVTVV